MASITLSCSPREMSANSGRRSMQLAEFSVTGSAPAVLQWATPIGAECSGTKWVVAWTLHAPQEVQQPVPGLLAFQHDVEDVVVAAGVAGDGRQGQQALARQPAEALGVVVVGGAAKRGDQVHRLELRRQIGRHDLAHGNDEPGLTQVYLSTCPRKNWRRLVPLSR